VDWREHLRWVRIGGRWVNGMEMGEGPPLLLVHGHSRCWHNWLENLPYFAERYRAVAPDLPGFGYSELPAERLSIESHARFPDARIPDARLVTLVRRPRLRWAALLMVAARPERLPAPMCAELLRGSGRPAAPEATDALVSYDYRDRLDDIARPTLIVWGDKDRTVPVAGADEYERLIPNSRKVILRDTGHVPMVERPARFNQLVAEFLAEEE